VCVCVCVCELQDLAKGGDRQDSETECSSVIETVAKRFKCMRYGDINYTLKRIKLSQAMKHDFYSGRAWFLSGGDRFSWLRIFVFLFRPSIRNGSQNISTASYCILLNSLFIKRNFMLHT